MSESADNVLAELASIGAVGHKKPKARPEARVDTVDVEEASPEAALVDRRGEEMVLLLTDAIDHLDALSEGLDGLRSSLEGIRRVWATEDLEEGSTPLQSVREELVRPPSLEEAPSKPEPVQEAPEDPQQDPDMLEAAREAARRKIRGEDLSEDEQARAFAEEEASIPYVGQDRASTPETDTGETTVGTLGSIKPSFPQEEESE